MNKIEPFKIRHYKIFLKATFYYNFMYNNNNNVYSFLNSFSLQLHKFMFFFHGTQKNVTLLYSYHIFED